MNEPLLSNSLRELLEKDCFTVLPVSYGPMPFFCKRSKEHILFLQRVVGEKSQFIKNEKFCQLPVGIQLHIY